MLPPQVSRGAGRVGVSSNLERILALQLEQRRDLVEHVRDRRLVHSIIFNRKTSRVDFGAEPNGRDAQPVIPRLAQRAEGPRNCNTRSSRSRRAICRCEVPRRLRGSE